MTRWLLASTTGAVLLCGCNDLVGNPPLPPSVQDPSVYTTPAGLQQQVIGTRGILRDAIGGYVVSSGLITDELMAPPVQTYSANVSGPYFDKHQFFEENPGSTGNVQDDAGYATLQGLRGQAHLTQLGLATYAPSLPAAFRGEMFGAEGYADLLLADLYCSGIPLTTLELGGSFHYQAGSNTPTVYQTALALFDSAARLAGDSGSVLTLARVGKARALLALGEYAAAAQAVKDVNEGDTYALKVGLGGSIDPFSGVIEMSPFDGATIPDREGINGYLYRSREDPRTATTTFTDPATGATLYQPTKYFTQSFDSSTVVLADWIEARLIQAEAALQSTPGSPNANAIQILNTLRAPYIATDSLTPIPTSGLTWNQQVDTLFYERAAWLFLTGHRQGDMRRMIRQYGRTPGSVYPTGPYQGPGGGTYGTDVNRPIPLPEYNNPLFHGCLSRGA